ncbi:BgTH12-07695 [Blumeria graminis f. sp. triticale]|uniref:BgTH12-07695 n=1 Tax=Blumeria graminis f. sp. triticale TaxID=1689686 RepID=A0A9W4GIB5_BLUGR|nr:BgTH12-07695 [Blumeria graminis f. sp. triticale]
MAKHLSNTIESSKGGAFHFWTPEEVEAVQQARKKFRQRLRNVPDLYADLIDPGPTAEEAMKYPRPEKSTPKKEERKNNFDDELPYNHTTLDRFSNLPTPRQNLYEAINDALFIFHRNCNINNVSYPARGHLFHNMLKGEALTFFSTEYLQEWESVSLQLTLQQHPDMSKADCFDVMLQNLLKIKKLLPSDMQTDSHLRLKMQVACKSYLDINHAVLKDVSNFREMTYNIWSSIRLLDSTNTLFSTHINNPATTHLQQRSSIPGTPNDNVNKTFWTDRKYNSNKPYHSGYNKDKQRRTRCYVCKKLGFVSYNHTDSEREEAFQKYANHHVKRQGGGRPSKAHYFTTIQSSTALLGQKIADALNEYSTLHAETGSKLQLLHFSPSPHPILPTSFLLDQYSANVFQGIIPDGGAAEISTADEAQFEELCQIDPTISLVPPQDKSNVRFGHAAAQKPLGTCKDSSSDPFFRL